MAQLIELQREITQLREYRFLWDSPGPGGTPKSEDTISDWVCQRLQARLQEAFFEREAHISSKGQGIGTRIDIEATATTATHPPGKAVVIAEAKLITNNHLRTAMRSQLVQQYMLPNGAHRASASSTGPTQVSGRKADAIGAGSFKRSYSRQPWQPTTDWKSAVPPRHQRPVTIGQYRHMQRIGS